MRQVCFLFNHDALHQIAHSLPVALILATTRRAEVTLAVTTPAAEKYIRSIAGPGLEACQLVRLDLQRSSSRLVSGALDGVLPLRKILLLRDNVAWFAQFDALIVPEKTSLVLRKHLKLSAVTALIHTRHGAGDRAIGFDASSALFDLILVAGPKIARRLEREAGVDPAKLRVVGYPKFDACAGNRADLAFPQPGLPTVLYNPHPSPRLSSWFAAGPALLEAFAASPRHNLLFAPHTMLFKRRWAISIDPPAVRRTVPPGPAVVAAANVRIDLGSPASIDMSYTNAASLYVGDVSSQVYEFLLTPRPCLFIDAHQTRWQANPNYAHWQAGAVITPDDDFAAAADRALDTHENFRAVQEALLRDTFSVTDQPASVRAADAIEEFLESRR